MILGVGVGSLKEEFDLLGAPFDDRGARGDDALRAFRAALPSNEPTYDGEFYSFGGLTVDPCALQPHMPFWIGGRTKRSLRRAVTLADGWCPFYVPDRHRRRMAARARRYLTASRWCCRPSNRSTRSEIRSRHEKRCRRWPPAGTTIVSARFVHHSLEHYLEQIHALVELHGYDSGKARYDH